MDTTGIARQIFRVWTLLRESLLTPGALAQLGVAAGLGLAAWGLGLLARRAYARRFARTLESGEMTGRLARAVGGLFGPLLFSGLCALARDVAASSLESVRIFDALAGLALAWVAIRLASGLLARGFLRSLIMWTALALAALHVTGLLAEVTGLLDAAAMTFGSTRVSLYMVLKGTLLFLVLFKAVSVVNQVAASRLASAGLSPSLKALTLKMVKLGLYTAAFLMAVSAVGVDLTSLAVLSGALGVGIGFGLREIFANLVSGVILLLEQSVKPGDVVEVEDVYGEVTELNVRYCVIRTRDGKEYLVPNESLITNPVVVWTHRDPVVRLKIPVGIHYDSDPRLAMDLMVRAARETGRVLTEPAPAARLTGFGDNSVDLDLRIWINDAQHGVVNVQSEVLLKVWDLFKEHGVAMPYPQRDIHIKELPPGWPGPPESSPGSAPANAEPPAPEGDGDAP
jgi:small-conductance mechanosensitive channel